MIDWCRGLNIIQRYDIKPRRHLACDLNDITQSGIGVWIHNHPPWRARDYVFILQSPSLCNAIQITGPCLLATSITYIILNYLREVTNKSRRQLLYIENTVKLRLSLIFYKFAPRQNGWQFADGIFVYNLHWNLCILMLRISSSSLYTIFTCLVVYYSYC